MDTTTHSRAIHTAPGAAGGTRITGVDIGIGDLIVLMIKIAIASIPATIIIMIVFGILGAIFGGIFAALIGAAGQ